MVFGSGGAGRDVGVEGEDGGFEEAILQKGQPRTLEEGRGMMLRQGHSCCQIEWIVVRSLLWLLTRDASDVDACGR